MSRLELRAPTAEATRDLGAAIARVLRRGDAVVLTGELGAGKTTFVQGVARELEVEDPVVSPTFTLIREYEGRIPIAHVDVYRLERIQDVVELGLDELGDGDDLLLVEWGDVIEDLLPPNRLRIELTVDEDSDERRIWLEAVGPAWVERWAELETLVQPWAGRSVSP